MLGISAGAYWALSALAAVGGVLVGLEYEDWRGDDAKVSLGSFSPLLIVIDAIIGMLGGRLSQAMRES